jgi:hypothetical protein
MVAARADIGPFDNQVFLGEPLSRNQPHTVTLARMSSIGSGDFLCSISAVEIEVS